MEQAIPLSSAVDSGSEVDDDNDASTSLASSPARGASPLQTSSCLEYPKNGPGIIILMGVSGVGKTTIGEQLASELGYPFFDGDDYHPVENVAKMRQGIPLTDEDRRPWLQTLHDLIKAVHSRGESAILACSALKRKYRDQLIGDVEAALLVYLKADYDLIQRRLLARDGHFMKADLLASQFATLEEPDCAIVADASLEPAAIAKRVKRQIHARAKAHQGR